MKLPEKIRCTNSGWTESEAAYKVQLGDENRTIAYVWVPGGFGDRAASEEAFMIATLICEGWNK